jgi:hypothetical protein
MTFSMTAIPSVEEVIMESYDLDDVLTGLVPGGCVQPYISGFIESLMDQPRAR